MRSYTSHLLNLLGLCLICFFKKKKNKRKKKKENALVLSIPVSIFLINKLIPVIMLQLHAKRSLIFYFHF